MTRDEKELLIENLDDVAVQPNEFMTLVEIEAYVKGFRNARDVFMDTIDQVYRATKTD